MAYSTAYQTVGAGGIVREDEAISFLGKNKIAVPSGVRSFTNTAATKQPTIEKEVFDDRGVGKAAASRDPQLGVYVGSKYNTV